MSDALLDVDGLARLIDALIDQGRTVIAPVRRDGVISYEPITGADELPIGWGDEQGPAVYRLRRRDDRARFGFAAAPQSPKRELFPPRTLLTSAELAGDGTFTVADPEPEARPVAFLGVRACELAAIDIHDRVFGDPAHPDPTYAARRAATFVIVVQCGSPAGTCFCASMDTGPRAVAGFDLALTELVPDDGGEPTYVVEVGSEAGAEVLASVPHVAASPTDVGAALAVTDAAAGRMGRSLDTEGLAAVLLSRPEHPRWDDVADRCLGCANCTMVCPTCFCHTVEDVTDLTGDHAERWRVWDSCFTLGFTELAGHPVRESTRSRYRQWLTHKLGTWWDQFGTSGCVGCGRCVTWCPVGIDLTEECEALRVEPTAAERHREEGR